MTSRALEVARFFGCGSKYFVSGISENETLRPSDGERVVPGVRSAFLRTVREGVRDRAQEDQVLVLSSVSCNPVLWEWVLSWHWVFCCFFMNKAVDSCLLEWDIA